MSKYIAFIVFCCAMFWGVCIVQGATVHIGDKVFTNTNTLTIDCSQVKDGNGVGMIAGDQKGNAYFRIGEVTATETIWKPWTDILEFAPEILVTFPFEVGKEYQLQGKFCDALGNCQKDADALMLPQTIKYVETNIMGEIKVKVTVHIEGVQ